MTAGAVRGGAEGPRVDVDAGYATAQTARAAVPLPALLGDLDAGRRRAAWPDSSAADGWRVDPDLRRELLALFREPATAEWEIAGLFGFRDRASLPTKRLLDGEWRVVPGGTSVRAGAYLGPGVVIMPPAYVNVGAWIGEGTMVDSHVLVGSCAQVGARVHLAAGVQVGGVLEPANARPVIVEDEAFVGAQCGLFEGVLVGRRAVLAAGVVLTGTSRVYDLVGERVLEGTPERPLSIPAGAVVVPATRPARGAFAEVQGVAIQCAAIVKLRDAGTDARTALEEALR